MTKPFAIKFFILILILIPFLGQAQQLDFPSEVGFSPKNIPRAMPNVMGSPYINEDYQQVRINGADNKIYSGRYNAYINEMEILVAAGRDPIALDISNNEYEVFFINENKLYKTFNYESNRGITKRGFLVVMSEENDVVVLKEEIVKYYDKVAASSSYDQDKPAKFRKEDDNYYIKLKSGRVVYLPSKDKDIAKAFPEHSKEIMTFVKKNKLKTKKEEDLIKVANFIGSL
jgi:hypothetical protein